MLCFNMILTGKCDFSEFTPANTDLFYNLWPGCSSEAAAGGDGGTGRFPLELCLDRGGTWRCFLRAGWEGRAVFGMRKRRMHSVLWGGLGGDGRGAELGSSPLSAGLEKGPCAS